MQVRRVTMGTVKTHTENIGGPLFNQIRRERKVKVHNVIMVALVRKGQHQEGGFPLRNPWSRDGVDERVI